LSSAVIYHHLAECSH